MNAKKKDQLETGLVAYPGGIALDRDGDPEKGRVRRAAMIRNDTLAWMLGRGTISRRQHDAGVLVRALWAARGGSARGFDPTQVKVDGGRGTSDGIQFGALAANDELRRLIRSADIGAEATEVLIRVCGESESLTAIAVDREDDPETRAQGGCTRDTLAEVRSLIRRALAGIANVANGEHAHGGRVKSEAVYLWMCSDNVPPDLAKRA